MSEFIKQKKWRITHQMISFKKKVSQKSTSQKHQSSKNEKDSLKENKPQVKKHRDKKKIATTQASLFYTSIYEDGLIHVVDNEYARIFKIGDADYMTANEEDKEAIVTQYASVLNSLDHMKHYQLFLHNRPKNTDLLDRINIPLEGDDLDELRIEYNHINSENLKRNKRSYDLDIHVVITVHAENKEAASRGLQDIQMDVLRKFDKMASVSELTGSDTLSLISLVTLNEQKRFDFAKEVREAGTTKSIIAPNHLVFDKRDFKIDDRHARVLYAMKYPDWLRDSFLRDLSNTGIEFFMSIHAQPTERDVALQKILQKTVSAKGDMAESITKAAYDGVSEEYAVGATQKSFVKSGEELSEQIQAEMAQVYSGTVAILLISDSKEALEVAVKRLDSAARGHQVRFAPALLNQEQGFNTVLPFGKNYLGVSRHFKHENWTTANVAASFIPWTNSDVSSESPKALYYGMNYLTKNPITLDRGSKEDLPTGSGMVFGMAGSGKGVFTKFTEIIPTFLKSRDEIIIVDPEGEYTGIADALGGQVIKLFPGATTHMNLLDKPDDSLVNKNDEDYVEPIAQKMLLLDNLFDSILNTKNEINYGASERSLRDRVTRLVYELYSEPTLQDWHQVLKEQPDDAAQAFALKLEPFMKGSESLFSHKTNVDINNRFVVFDLKQLKKSKLYNIAMLVVQDYIWNRVLENQGKVRTRIYFDEIQAYFDNEEMASFFANLYARVRKYGAIPVGITQDPGLILQGGKAGEAIFTNTEFFAMMRLKGKNLNAIAEYLELTEEQVKFLRYADGNRGEGLIIAKNHVVQMENPIPEGSKIFNLVDTTVANN